MLPNVVPLNVTAMYSCKFSVEVATSLFVVPPTVCVTVTLAREELVTVTL